MCEGVLFLVSVVQIGKKVDIGRHRVCGSQKEQQVVHRQITSSQSRETLCSVKLTIDREKAASHSIQLYIFLIYKQWDSGLIGDKKI